MFRKKTKKGFTIVELVIVIAVIAILSAVLIPTFAGLIKKANISADQTLVRNLNTSLAISSEGGGTKNSTMYQTLEAMKEQGYVVDKLTPTHSKNNIVWDSENNQFVLVYENGKTFTGTTVDPTVDKSKMWKVYTEIPTESEYSVYLAGTNVTGNVEVKGVGFDAGENVGISTVTYKNETTVAKDVVIRTNDDEFVTELTIEAPNDTVSHYGWLNTLDVKSVDPAHSYHEYGKVRMTATIESGRFVVENGAEINEVKVPSTATNQASVLFESGAKVDILTIDNSVSTVEIESGVSINQILGEIANVTGSGSTEVTANAEEVTYVYDQATVNSDSSKLTLIQALNAKKKYIKIAEDLNVGSAIEICADCVIEGNNHTINSTYSRGFKLNTSKINVTIKNLKYITSSLDSNVRALQIDSNKTNVILKVDNVIVEGAKDLGFTAQPGSSGEVDFNQFKIEESKYPINLSTGSCIDVNINHSFISGYCALNLYSTGNKIFVSNSELYGINSFSGSSDNFGTIVLEGDTTQQTDMHSLNVNLKIQNSKIYTKETGTANENHIQFNSQSVANSVELDNCVFYEYANDDYVVVSQAEVDNRGNENKLFINGVKISI